MLKIRNLKHSLQSLTVVANTMGVEQSFYNFLKRLFGGQDNEKLEQARREFILHLESLHYNPMLNHLVSKTNSHTVREGRMQMVEFGGVYNQIEQCVFVDFNFASLIFLGS